jgi:hypothetical protein
MQEEMFCDGGETSIAWRCGPRLLTCQTFESNIPMNDIPNTVTLLICTRMLSHYF